jgi:GNAT superfamily N-acetyltransferase
MTQDFVLRAPTADDLNFIRATWIREAALSRYARAVGRQVFFREHTRVRDVLLERSEVVILGLASVEDAICAWAAIEPPAVVHFVHVKSRWRGRGFARQLLAPLSPPVVYTHQPDSLDLTRLPPDWTFNPYRGLYP